MPVEDIRRFEAEFLDYSARDTRDPRRDPQTSGLSDETVAQLDSAIEEFKTQFTTSSGELLVKDEPVEAARRRRHRSHQDHREERGLDHGCAARVYRRRIKSVQATKKITKAMEMIASSRIVKAQQRSSALPYLTQLCSSDLRGRLPRF